jgi:YHS domain-containing protein
VVSYFEDHPKKGRKEFGVEHGGVTWWFSSAEHRKLFVDNPDRFLPQYGGFCAYSVAQGYPATADPGAYKVDGGKPQYCSLNDFDRCGEVSFDCRLRHSRPQRIVAHLSLHTSRVDAIAAGTAALLKDLVENRFMKCFSVRRGE